MPEPAAPALVDIPLIDVRDGGAVRHAIDGATRARSLRDDCVAWLPSPARMVLPVMDGMARRWLLREWSGGGVIPRPQY